LPKLTLERRRRGLAGLELAPGKFPIPWIRGAFEPLRQKHLAVAAREHCGGDGHDSAIAHLITSAFIRQLMRDYFRGPLAALSAREPARARAICHAPRPLRDPR